MLMYFFIVYYSVCYTVSANVTFCGAISVFLFRIPPVPFRDNYLPLSSAYCNAARPPKAVSL